jgi:hypothetical protein
LVDNCLVFDSENLIDESCSSFLQLPLWFKEAKDNILDFVIKKIETTLETDEDFFMKLSQHLLYKEIKFEGFYEVFKNSMFYDFIWSLEH